MKRYFLSIFLLSASSYAGESEIPSFYCPSNFQLIPNNGGISFIDNGRLWIKRWHRHLPQSPLLNYLLAPLGPVKWLDENTCYTSAKRHDRFSIYRISIDGCVACLASCANADCLFPCIVEDGLFFIKRTKGDRHHSLVYVPYSNATPEAIVDFFNPPQPCEPEEAQITLVDFGNREVAFLHMISRKEGFAIVDSSYHQLSKKNDTWQSAVLFNIRLPAERLE